ncbi:hypothetical protein KEJ33_02330 [Candidatus Bathyarchaeota archaeon]|nr:hypothetical protein [Candidatus Bathyarchaeota archaeon]
MSQARVIREETKVGDNVYSVVLIEAKNGYVVLLSEGQDSIGTLAVSVPQTPGMIGPPLSSTLLGERNVTLARMLAERLANSLKKIVLVSVFVKTATEAEAGRMFLGLLEKTLKKLVREGES